MYRNLNPRASNLTGFDAFSTRKSKLPTAEEIEMLIKHYGLIWDNTSDLLKEMCGLKFITREGYIRKSLAVYHGIEIEQAKE